MKNERAKNEKQEKMIAEPPADGAEVINSSRRRALKTIAVGSAAATSLALGSKWAKPVVDTVILPAHAQATNVEAPDQGTTSAPTTTPTATTTSNAIMIAWACWQATYAGPADDRYISELTVTGALNSTQAGVNVRIDARLLLQGAHNETIQSHVTTNASGEFSTTWTFAGHSTDRYTEVTSVYVYGPNNNITASECTG